MRLVRVVLVGTMVVAVAPLAIAGTRQRAAHPAGPEPAAGAAQASLGPEMKAYMGYLDAEEAELKFSFLLRALSPEPERPRGRSRARVLSPWPATSVREAAAGGPRRSQTGSPRLSAAAAVLDPDRGRGEGERSAGGRAASRYGFTLRRMSAPTLA
mgnify:CR=1 FL=1